MKVLYFGTYRPEYERNQLMIARLRAQDVQVVECHEHLWHGFDDQDNLAGGGWMNPRFWKRVMTTYARLLRKYRKVGDYDVLIVGYPGPIDIYLARLLTWMRKKPLGWDFLFSIYQESLDRDLNERSPFTSKLIRRGEGLGCHLADIILVETHEYGAWIRENYNVPTERTKAIPLGADDRKFQPPTQTANSNGMFRCLYYGTYIPNHGVQHIIEAARLLSDNDNIHFEMVGEGPNRKPAIKLAQKYNLQNITFIGWQEKEALIKRMANADICLASFGAVPHAQMSVQNKIYEGMAMGKLVLTGDSPAVRRNFNDGEHLYLCERANPESLANAILKLHDDRQLREKIARAGQERYSQSFTMDKIGAQFKQYLDELMTER